MYTHTFINIGAPQRATRSSGHSAVGSTMGCEPKRQSRAVPVNRKLGLTLWTENLALERGRRCPTEGFGLTRRKGGCELYIHTHTHTHLSIYLSIYLSISIYIYIYVYLYLGLSRKDEVEKRLWTENASGNQYESMCTYIYIYIHTYMYVYLCIKM